jgi:2-polyprenyl-3-methyl-5-hydroxy-6-metoxy-1,4-benzoquinol methylase
VHRPPAPILAAALAGASQPGAGGGRPDATPSQPGATGPDPEHVQRDQPPGVPPLALTGERTLPDVPAENYWFSRHLAVYQWVARRCAGTDVVDMACGEGYGSAVLAEHAARVVGVDANPEAYEHARAKYASPRVRFERRLIDAFDEPCDAVVFLQTIEHVEDPAATLSHLLSLLRPGGVAYVSTPNVLTLAPPGADRSGNPWHLREYRPHEFRELCERCASEVTLYGLHHARKLWMHERALALGWDWVHRALGLTGAFYGRFVPAISAADFSLREVPAGPAGDRRLEGALDFVAALQ